MKKIIFYYFIFLFSFLSLFSSGVIDSQDGFQYLAVARNIYYKGEPTAPEYEYDTRENIHMSTVVGKDGKSYSLTGLGFSIPFLPAVAITDLVYKFYGISPPVHFPLENDWLIFLTASFTNSFFGAMVAVILFLYLLELGLTRKQAFFISLVGIFSTNLLIYTKHSFPHMMFITFLLLSFYLVKLHFRTKKKLLLLLAGVSYGISAITYSQTFLLAAIPLGIYFLLLSKFKLKVPLVKSLFWKFLIFALGFLPFVFLYIWFENLRATATFNLGSSSSASSAVNLVSRVPFGVLIEGVYGQLFSPGRSIFLYSPILLLSIFFWHKIQKKSAEVWALITLSAIYILFFSVIYNPGDPTLLKGVAALWHGELSWGPRYLTIIIPFGMLIVGLIYSKLTKIAKLLIFYPLIILGLYVQLLGVLMPYQIKLHELEDRFFINNTEYTNFLYSNLIARYSPVFMMSKKLVKLYQSFPQTLNHGELNVKFYDGIDFPFPVGGEKWRVIERQGYISFDNLQKDPVKKITIGLINHPIEEASYSAVTRVSLNNKLLKEQKLLPTERKLLELSIPGDLLKARNNQVQIDVEFKSPNSKENKSFDQEYRDDPALYENKNLQPRKYVSQILGLISFSINERAVNKDSLDFPYVSPLGPAMTGIKYKNFGGEDKDPWKTWHIHTQMYERIPDFWWVRNLFYWDIPKTPIFLLFTLFVLSSIYFGFKTTRLIRD